MKKLWLVFLCLIPMNIKAISASSYIVMDQNSKQVLLGHNINDKRLIASTTKIMTCIIAIEYGLLDKEYIVSSDVLKAYGSAIYIEVGEKLKLKDLIYGLMLRSGNDAAIEIANDVSGSMDSFVYLMNEKASNLKMKNTHFINNHGLEENDGSGNISTAYDMALLMSYAMKNKIFREIVQTKSYSVKTNYKTYKWVNKNKLLHNYDFITGGKTGYTKRALRTLVTSGSKNNIDLVIVTLNDGNDFEDHITLYNQIFNNYESKMILDKNNFSLKDNNFSNGYFKLDYDFKLTLKKESKEKISIDYEIYNDEVSNGDYGGIAKIYLNDNLVGTRNLIWKNAKKLKLKWWQKIFGGWHG